MHCPSRLERKWGVGGLRGGEDYVAESGGDDIGGEHVTGNVQISAQQRVLAPLLHYH